jgi:hypothetical protein
MFTAGQNFQVGGSTRGVGLADFNQDGLLDIMAVGQSSAQISVILGQQPPGTFGMPQGYATDPYPVCAVAKDVNGDGILDLVVANAGGNSIGILAGQGDGTFAMEQDIPLTVSPSAVDVADL